MITASTIARRPKLAVAETFSGRCDAAPMKKSIGIEKSVLVREARPALAPAAAASGSALPPAATAVVDAMTIFWLGQMMNQTLAHMKRPRTAPVRIVTPQ